MFTKLLHNPKCVIQMLVTTTFSTKFKQMTTKLQVRSMKVFLYVCG